MTKSVYDPLLGRVRTSEEAIREIVKREVAATGGAGGNGVDGLWEMVTYGVEQSIQPIDTTKSLIVGNDLHSSVPTAFADYSAVFNGNPSGSNTGVGYYLNLAYGTSFLPFGGSFLSGHARGTSSAPTQTQAGDFFGVYGFTGFGTTAWSLTGATHTLAGYWGAAAANVTDAAIETDLWMGGATTKMILLETDTSAIKFNEAALDSDITFYSDTGTPLIVDGATLGTLIIGNGTNIQFNTSTGSKIGTATTQKIGFWNATPVVQSTGWTASNVTTDKSFDADSTSLDEVADVLGTLINQLKTYGILGA